MEPKKPVVYIIDLDGTLYDNHQRKHLIPQDRDNCQGWINFNCACAGDTLREDVADLVRIILQSGSRSLFVTGRGEVAREETNKRLRSDFNFIDTPILLMRPMDEHGSGTAYKSRLIQWLMHKSGDFEGCQFVALEDDPAIVAAMRELGVTVLQIDSRCCAVS